MHILYSILIPTTIHAVCNYIVYIIVSTTNHAMWLCSQNIFLKVKKQHLSTRHADYGIFTMLSEGMSGCKRYIHHKYGLGYIIKIWCKLYWGHQY